MVFRADIVPIHNEILGAGQHRDKFGSGRRRSDCDFRRLRRACANIIERPPFSFSNKGWHANNVPFEVHVELQRWLRKIYVEFRQMELRVLLTDSRVR